MCLRALDPINFKEVVSSNDDMIRFNTETPLMVNETKTMYLCATNSDHQVLFRQINYHVCGNERFYFNQNLFSTTIPKLVFELE